MSSRDYKKIKAALRRGAGAVMAALEESGDPDLGALILWSLHYSEEDPEYGRLLAIRTACENDSISVACRLWLMAHSAGDLGIANTLIGTLEAEVFRGKWPAVLGGELINFLRSCLQHEEISIGAGVLSVLSMGAQHELLNSAFSRPIAISLANLLIERVEPHLEEDERDDFRTVSQILHHVTPETPPALAPRGLQRATFDLQDAAEKYDNIPHLDMLIDFVRRRALMDDAGRQAVRIGRPIQTFRVLAQETSTRLIQAFISYSEAVVGVERRPDFAETPPDYGTQLAWAPAASMPLHLLFADDEAPVAYGLLQGLVNAEGKRRQVIEAVAALPPTVAEALLGLIARLEQHQGRVEIILTDPLSPLWQQTLEIGPGVLGSMTRSGLARRARDAVRTTGGVVVESSQVPQANTVKQVLQAVDAMQQRAVVTLDDISGIDTVRQVNYYRHGARILGLFDEDNQLTDRARALIGLPLKPRLAITAVYFEDSQVGRAWRAWAGKDRLMDVDPGTAEEFLQQCSVGLSSATIFRRESSLRAWHGELMAHYPE